MNRNTLLRAAAVAALAIGFAGPGFAQRGSESPPVQRDALLREVAVPLRDGRLSLRKLCETLLAAYELDGTALRIPDRSVDVRGLRGRLLLLATRKTLLDTVRFRRDLRRDVLVVTIDRERTREVRRRLRARIVSVLEQLTGTELSTRQYELALPARLDPARPLALLIHGVESDAEVWSDLRGYLAEDPRGFQVGTFAYPNDEAVDTVAAELSENLRGLGEQPVAIVAHSMGGLVARAVIEDPRRDPGNVVAVIQIGTPNRGSNLGGMRFALDAAHLLERPDGDVAFGRALLAGMRDNLIDGLGEAGGDLLPGSVFLTRLNERPRNARVHYHAVLGTRAILRPRQLQTISGRVGELLGKSKVSAVVRPKAERWLGDLDELVAGKGDGAVSVARGRLPGVEPVLVPLDHVGLVRLRGMTGRIERGADHPVFTRVAEWLERLD